MKKFICVLLILSSIVTVLSMYGCSNSGGTVSDDMFVYTLIEDGVGSYYFELGKGTYMVSAKDPAKLKGNVVIPDEFNGIPVTAIDGYGFKDCDKITSVVIGENIEYIGTAAFFRCDLLQTVSLPSSIKEIGRLGIVGQCPMLMSAEYNGTTSEFDNIKGNATDSWVNTDIYVSCTDGAVRVYDKKYN